MLCLHSCVQSPLYDSCTYFSQKRRFGCQGVSNYLFHTFCVLVFYCELFLKNCFLVASLVPILTYLGDTE